VPGQPDTAANSANDARGFVKLQPDWLAMRFLLRFAQFELRTRRNGNATSLLLAKPGQSSKLFQQQLFLGGCAFWKLNPEPGSQQCLRPSTAVPQKTPSLFPVLVATL
jgi:hypothetical protein